MNDLTNEELVEQIRRKWDLLMEKLYNHEIKSIEYATRRKAYESIIVELTIKDEDRIPVNM